MNVNFRDKNFMMATFFHDYCGAHMDMTIHINALLTILTCGVGYLFNVVVGGFNTRRKLCGQFFADLVDNFARFLKVSIQRHL